MNKNAISKLIKEIEITAPINIQISGSKENNPKPIGFSRSDKKFMPDIVAKFEHKKDIYAIEKDFSEKDIHLLVSKWILFAADARKSFGTFYLAVPKSKVTLVEKIIQEKQLDIKLIQI